MKKIPPASELKRTPLYDVHRKMGAKMTEFAGWEMPLEYKGIIREHLNVRERAGLFDLSHMGELELLGQDALRLLQFLTPNDVARLSDGQAQYSALITRIGTFVDDLLVYRINENHFMLCVNAANTRKDYDWICEHKFGNVEVKNSSDDYALLAVQGPLAQQVLQKLTCADLSGIKYYRFVRDDVAGTEALISRTGYTGEDGFELFVPPQRAEELWFKLLDAGDREGILPVGLGARNTLRLEAKLLLYGNDIDESTTVLEADLERIVKFHKGEFIGKDALLRQKSEGVKRLLVGFEMIGDRIARDRYPIFIGDRQVGAVTSGSPAPYLKRNIGLAYLPIEHARVGVEFDVLIRNRMARARVVPTPFYRRRKQSDAPKPCEHI